MPKPAIQQLRKEECTPTRVLVIENSREVAEELQALFDANYHCEIVVGSGRQVVEQAIQFAQTFRPHVAIVDLRIGGSPRLDAGRKSDKLGMELLLHLADAKCILRSAYLSRDDTRMAWRQFGAFDAIRSDADWEEQMGVVANAASKVRPCLNGFRTDWLNDDCSPHLIVKTLFEHRVQEDLVEDVIGLLLPETSMVKIDRLDDAILTSGSIARGRSIVLRVWKNNQLQPAVIKIAPRTKILEEASNYRTFIHGNLQGHFHSILEGEPQTRWDIGGICYTFLGAPSGGPEKFATRFRRTANISQLLKPLTHFFEKVWQPLYTDTRVLNRSLFRAYDEAFGLTNRLCNYPNQAETLHFPGVPTPLPNPIVWLNRRAEASYLPGMKQSRTHGDLHADNLFVSDEHAWAIDFGRSGWGHILRDFVELEIDVITRLVDWPGDSFMRLFRLTTFLMQENHDQLPNSLVDHPASEQTFLLINALRKVAKELTRYVDFREYLWGLLLDAVFVATFDSTERHRSAQRENALLMAAVIANRLEYGDNRWPPDDWPVCYYPTGC